MKSQVCWCLYITLGLLIGVEAGLRVLGGRDALKDEFPFAVRLENVNARNQNPKLEDYFQFCSGAAIASTWILTAAHCSDNKNKPDIKKFARCNSYFPNIRGDLSALFEFYIHPGYKDESDLNNDFGLFRCEKLPISSFARISAVDYKSIIGNEAVILGFGRTNASEFDKPLQVLRGMFTKCTYPYKQSWCVRPSCGVVATLCGGDSGGPALLASHIVGVTSKIVGDCYEDTKSLKPSFNGPAGIISMVSPYLNWIQKVVSNKPSAL